MGQGDFGKMDGEFGVETQSFVAPHLIVFAPQCAQGVEHIRRGVEPQPLDKPLGGIDAQAVCATPNSSTAACCAKCCSSAASITCAPAMTAST